MLGASPYQLGLVAWLRFDHGDKGEQSVAAKRHVYDDITAQLHKWTLQSPGDVFAHISAAFGVAS